MKKILSISLLMVLILTVILVLGVGCTEKVDYEKERKSTVATPTLSPRSGVYYQPQTVTMSCETPGATIRYTTDGSEPTQSSPAYYRPIVVSVGSVVKAKASKSGWFDSKIVSSEYRFQIATPTFDPPEGLYYDSQFVKISCATAGATIRYTTNGSEPNQFSSIYNKHIEITSGTTLKARAFRSGWIDSPVAEVKYDIADTIATPTFDPPKGTYNGIQNVTISCAVSGASIYYTKDGKEPTSSSSFYSSPVEINKNTTLKAKAFKSGWNDSEIGIADYKLRTAMPKYDPPEGTYDTIKYVAISCATEGATIYYTTDGKDPTSSSAIYSTPLKISENTTLKATAFKSGWVDSSVATATYTMDVKIVATPTFKPSEGLYKANQNVTISCTTSDATIRYTIDGSEPEPSSPEYSSPVPITKNTTLKAKAFKSGWNDSEVGIAEYNFQPDKPTFNPSGGTYNTSQIVYISCDTNGTTIHYTTDKTNPTTSSPEYSSLVPITQKTTLKAKAFKSGWNDSEVESADYDFNIATPVFYPSGDIYYQPQSVAIECTTGGVTITYTTNGDEPTQDSQKYNDRIEIASGTTLKAKAFKPGWNDSPVASAKYTIVLTEAVDVLGGTFLMGRTKGKDGDTNELPVHDVTLSSFCISKYLVTQSEYEKIMKSNPARDGYGIGNNNPVYDVSWYDAIKYCNLLSMKEGLTPVYSIGGSTDPKNWGDVPKIDNSTWNAAICNWEANGYRLPTEAEWEYAARGGTNNPDYLYSGSDDIGKVAWYYGNNSPNGTKPVGGKAPNGLDIYDMSGNLYEWCWDWYEESYYSNSPSSNPKGPESGSRRIRRGGCWDHGVTSCRIAVRFYNSPSSRQIIIGFRVCRAAQ